MDAERGLAALPGVTSAAFSVRAGDISTFAVETAEGRTAEVQRAITRFATDHDLTLISNAEETLDLESVFLRLVDQKETPA